MNKTGQVDYYETLGVNKKASVDEIKKAYRRQAVQNHPDKGGDEAKFKQINEAYEVLSNPEKRQRYDQFGAAGLGGQSSGQSYKNTQGFDFNFSQEDFDLGDIFSDIFGGNRRSQSSGTPTVDAQAEIEISFKEAVFGVEKTISIRLASVCSKCSGKRVESKTDLKKCINCAGRGRVEKQVRSPFGLLRQETTCPNCQGLGAIISNPCSGCGGEGLVEKEREIKISIPAGVPDGATIRAPGNGPQNNQGQSGDLYLLLQVAPDKKFTREDSLILSEEVINFSQAALGDKVSIETIDGSVIIQVPAGTQSGTDFKIPNRGAPHLNRKGRGDHIVRLRVETPTKLNSQQKELLKRLASS